MKQDAGSPLSFRRHVWLWWRETRRPLWIGLWLVYWALLIYLLNEKVYATVMLFGLMFLLGQVGLWWAVEEREHRLARARRRNRRGSGVPRG